MQMQAHNHEFFEPAAEYYEDGAYIIHYDCEHVEILDSYTDDSRDEIYYEEGQSCDATKRVRLDPSALYMVVDDGDDYLMAEDDDTLWNQYDTGNHTFDILLEVIDSTLFSAITDNGEVKAEWNDDEVEVYAADEKYVSFIVTYAGEQYRIDFDNVTEEVDYY